jgi:hypothetical protein
MELPNVGTVVTLKASLDNNAFTRATMGKVLEVTPATDTVEAGVTVAITGRKGYIVFRGLSEIS